MAKKTYRSAQGKTIDLGAIQLQNENVRAVGNMGVNARGDVINQDNATVKGRTTRIGAHYKKQVNNVSDDSVPTTKHDQPKPISKDQKRKVKEKTASEQPVEAVQPEPVNTVAQPVTEDPAVESQTSIPEGGLAAAIAKARTVKQEAMKTPRQIAQEKSGVTKI